MHRSRMNCDCIKPVIAKITERTRRLSSLNKHLSETEEAQTLSINMLCSCFCGFFLHQQVVQLQEIQKEKSSCVQ